MGKIPHTKGPEKPRDKATAPQEFQHIKRISKLLNTNQMCRKLP